MRFMVLDVETLLAVKVDLLANAALMAVEAYVRIDVHFYDRDLLQIGPESRRGL